MTEKQQFKKTRIAPTPSGYLHLGNVLSFAITAHLAKKYGAKILLRIDDMDRGRANAAYVRDIFETLQFLEIPWDEGPKDEKEFERDYSQVHRQDIYERALRQLREQGVLFACNCSRSQLAINNPGGIHKDVCENRELSLETEDVSWRVLTPSGDGVQINTLQGTHNYEFPPAMTDFVVRKKDRMPAYQLTSLVDDLHFGVDFVVRGEDLLPSTISQKYLATLIDGSSFMKATFVHHSLLCEKDGNKLSKSAGATSIQYLRGQNKKAKDIFTLVARNAGISEPACDWEELGELITNSWLHHNIPL